MSLTLAEARARSAQVSDVSYELDLDLRDHAGETFGSTTTLRFTTTGPSTFVELTDARDLVVTVDGRRVEAAYDGRRIALEGLPVGVPVEVRVEAQVPYVSDGDGMHRMTDPVDGETYVSAYLSLDIAQRVFACFDQPDIKATMAVAVAADPRWQVIGNGRATSGEDGRWVFATTPRLCPSLFVVCAGPWHSVTWEHAGLPFGWHARASLAAELDRDADELRRTTVDCFDHYATLFDEPYPFDSYDQLFGPGHNWGAMETPGCVTYRDELLPRGRVTDDQRSRRATVIAHEMAHMWFGNLVTMRWWEDTWLNESFADYMGYRVAAEGAGFGGTLVVHEAVRKPAAYVADERRSTHPVAPAPQDVPDVDAAFTNFDAISYAKGNSCLRQLVTWLGDEDFLAGVNAHLTRHRFGNATLDDLVEALDAASPRDVRGWAEVWLRRSGFDTVVVRRRDDGVPVLVREGVRPHRFSVSALDADGGARGDPPGRPRRRGGGRCPTGPGWPWCPTAGARPSRGCASTTSRPRPWPSTSAPSTTRSPAPCCGRTPSTRCAPVRWRPPASSTCSSGTCPASGGPRWSRRCSTARSVRCSPAPPRPPRRPRWSTGSPLPAGPRWSPPTTTRWRSR